MEVRFSVGLHSAFIFVFLALGYIAIIISVVSDQSRSVPPPRLRSADSSIIDNLQAQLKNRNAEIENLKKLQLENNLQQPDHIVVKTKPIELHIDSKDKIGKLVSGSQLPGRRPGVIVLGMHRSGTSVVGGLMNKMGLNTGGPLIEAAEDNAKGFFERIDVVLQNDALFQRQGIHYSSGMYKYDAESGLKAILEEKNEKFFREGKRALAFLNSPSNYPWMLKDPRLCITLRTWIPLLNFVPAILFTYRHPLDVALSLNKREHFAIQRGLKMWYVYNRRAVAQSDDLCRVISSHRAIMSTPQVEMDRIFDELNGCGVSVPHKANADDVASFVDVKLQHGRSSLKDDSCEKDLTTVMPPETWPTPNAGHIALYREAMRVFCAFEDRSAFSPNFVWDMKIKDE